MKAEDFPVGLFSGLHADLDSLERLLSDEPGVKRWFCVGDYIDMRAFKDTVILRDVLEIAHFYKPEITALAPKVPNTLAQG